MSDLISMMAMTPTSGALVVALLMALRTTHNSRKFGAVAGLLIAFFVWSCLSLITGGYLHDGLLETTRVAAVIAWFFIIRTLLLESSDGQTEWGTVGLSENIIDASLQALVDSIEYYLSKPA